MLALSCERKRLARLSGPELYSAIIKRRTVLRTHRDQVGDNRCFLDDYLLFAFVEGLPGKPPKLNLESGMPLCRKFYEHCRLDQKLSNDKHAILDPSRWDNDLINRRSGVLLNRLETIQLEVVVLYEKSIRKPLNVADYRRLYQRTLPEGIEADFRLPSEPEFLGESKSGAGCPQFWKSHANCNSESCDLHQWGPCS